MAESRLNDGMNPKFKKGLLLATTGQVLKQTSLGGTLKSGRALLGSTVLVTDPTAK